MTEVQISQENLLGYVNGNKLWHDNTQMSNTFLSYYKGGWYGHEYREPQQSNQNNNEEDNDE